MGRCAEVWSSIGARNGWPEHTGIVYTRSEAALRHGSGVETETTREEAVAVVLRLDAAFRSTPWWEAVR